MKLSVIIPSYKDPYLQDTTDSLLQNSELGDELEIIAILDGYLPDPPLKSDKRLKIIHLEKNRGMRGSINAGLAEAKGEFVMKCDSHCLFDPGFDRIMSENCAENWLLVPRKYSLNEISWTSNDSRPVRDYYYLAFPTFTRYGYEMAPGEWRERTRQRKDPKYDIDDTMTFPGSCWFVNKKYFMKRVGFLDDRRETYGPFWEEPLEIGLKYWLGGGEIKVIKKTWYAHLSKRERHYKEGIYTKNYKRKSRSVIHRTWATKHWMNNEEPNMIHPMSWLIEKFWPVPSWEHNWKEIYERESRTTI